MGSGVICVYGSSGRVLVLRGRWRVGTGRREGEEVVAFVFC